jgi:macrolide transport system ATP-binding/permease protein
VLDAADIAVAGRLDSTSLTFTAGERLLITGPNGAGKSTLLSVLAGELAPDSGNVTRRGRIGYLPQEPQPDGPGKTLLAAFALGRAGQACTARILGSGADLQVQAGVSLGIS